MQEQPENTTQQSTPEATPTRIRPRERDAILQSLRAGVVPRVGLQHFQVGRANEMQALMTDLDRIADGGSGFRFVIGDYGSGKTFFMQLVRSIALRKKLVTVHADLTPERRLYGTSGQARDLYAELMRNLATQANPEGGALESVVERFISAARERATTEGITPDEAIQQGLKSLSDLTNGYDFAFVIGQYWRGYEEGNSQLQSDAVRWLRAEFATRTDARNALGVRTIITDANFYDSLKLMATFVRLAGFDGLYVCLDEMVNIYKLAHTQSRNSNYEQILRIVNDSLQGTATGLGFMFLGTPDFLTDPRRGLYSYEALQSRLSENTFARGGLIDYTGPVLRLASLTREDLFVLLQRLRHVQAGGDPQKYLVDDEAIRSFMHRSEQRLGEKYFRNPRNTNKTFLDLLALLEQNPGLVWTDLIEQAPVEEDVNPDLAPLPPISDTPEPRSDDAPVDSGSGEVDSAASENDDDDELTTYKL